MFSRVVFIYFFFFTCGIYKLGKPTGTGLEECTQPTPLPTPFPHSPKQCMLSSESPESKQVRSGVCPEVRTLFTVVLSHLFPICGPSREPAWVHSEA